MLDLTKRFFVIDCRLVQDTTALVWTPYDEVQGFVVHEPRLDDLCEAYCPMYKGPSDEAVRFKEFVEVMYGPWPEFLKHYNLLWVPAHFGDLDL